MTYCVAIAAFNAGETIADTLDSVLRQSVPPAEVWVVDDGSTDATAAIAERFGSPVHVIRQRNAGQAIAYNKAIEASVAPIIALVDADDVWLPQKMKLQLEALARLQAMSIVFTLHRTFRHGSDPDQSGEPLRSFFRSNAVFRRSVFDSVGPFVKTRDNIGDMVDWLGRARELECHFEMVEETLLLRRIIPSSLTYRNKLQEKHGLLEVARQAILRKRQAQNGGQDE